MGVHCASKTWSFSSVCKNLGGAAPFSGRKMVSRKSQFGCVWFDLEMSIVTGPKFTRLFFAECKESWSIKYFSDFKYLHPFQTYPLSKSEVVQTRAEFCMSLAQKFFWGRPPKFLTGVIKFSLLLIMVQNLMPIGRWSLEISSWNF